MTLPCEVTDFIIDLIAEDRQTLCAIAQVARVFVGRAHHHLFSTIHLKLPFPKSSLDKTAEMLQAFSHVLRDGLRFPGMGIINHLRHFYIKDLLGFVNDATSIFSLLGDVNHLESLTLGLHLSFSTLGEECRASLIHLCRSQSLNALTIYGLFDIPKSLLHGSHIMKIHLSYFNFLSYPLDQPKIVYQPESITTIGDQFLFALDAFHAGGGQIESPTRYKEALASLKKLDITICRVADIPSCLDAASFAGALEQLKLHISTSSDWFPISIVTCSFNSLSNLRILQLDFDQSNLPPLDWLMYIAQILRSCCFPSSLENLWLSLITRPVVFRGDDLPRCELDNMVWNSLDDVLITPSFCSIPSMTLTFRRLLKFQLKAMPDGKAKDHILLEHGRCFIAEDKMPLFTASRPGNFVVHVQAV